MKEAFTHQVILGTYTCDKDAKRHKKPKWPIIVAHPLKIQQEFRMQLQIFVHFICQQDLPLNKITLTTQIPKDARPCIFWDLGCQSNFVCQGMSIKYI